MTFINYLIFIHIVQHFPWKIMFFKLFNNLILLQELHIPGAILVFLLVKVKLSRNRPWRPIGLWDVKDPTLSRQSAYLVALI
jgi:hypothetical protein